MTISAFPTPTPDRTQEPEVFDPAMAAFLAQFPTFVTEANTLAVAMNLNSTTDASVSSVLIGLGAKTFTVSAGKSFQPGMYLVAADTAAPSTNSMYLQVTSYSGTSLVATSLAVRGSGTIASWVISQSSGGINIEGSAAQTFSVAPATAATHAVRLDNVSLYPTVASTAAPDIFGAAGATINYTGTTTATSFVACTAAQVGSTKRIITTGVVGFTAYSGLVFNGETNGTYVVGAGTVLDVIAIATNQFKIFTREQFGSATLTAVGLTTSPTAVVTYRIIGKMCFLKIPQNNLSGTSNSTGFSATGLPAVCSPGALVETAWGTGVDASAYCGMSVKIAAGGTTLIFAKNGDSGGWTATGGKSTYTTEFSYLL